MKKKITALLLLLFIFGMGAASLILPDREFSRQENRYLEQCPRPSVRNLADGSFMSRLETYLADQSPLRDFLVQAHNSLLRLTGRRLINQVYFSPDQRLIQVYDVDLSQAQRNLTAVNRWVQALPEEIPVSFVLAPTAAAVYRDQLPDFDLGYDFQALETLLEENLDGRIRRIDLAAAMEEHREEAIYFRTDHHWTMRGAGYGWEAIRQVLGLEGPARTYEWEAVSEDFLGSLYSQAPTLGARGEALKLCTAGSQALMTATSAGVEEHPLIWREKLAEKDQYTAFLGGNYGEMVITNPQAPDRTLLLFKDSYANAVLPFMSEEYREIHVIDLRYFRSSLQEYVQKKQPDQIMFLYNADFFCTDNNFVWLKME